MLRVTTSWDDGDILDRKLSDLLTRYNLKGTFYIAQKCRPNHLSEKDIKELAQKQEVGAHTINHPDLRKLSLDEKREEIKGSKNWLEKIVEREIEMFCYPKGFYDSMTISIVGEAGFLGARGVQSGSWSYPEDRFQTNTTIQVYPFPFRKLDQKHYYWKKMLEPYRQRSPKFQALGVSKISMYSWLSLAKATFDLALQKGEVFHIFGHSWEIEKYGMWDELERFFQYIANRKTCEYLTNGELLKVAPTLNNKD